MTNPRERIQAASDLLVSDRAVPVATMGEVGEIVDEHGSLRDGDSWGPWTWDADAGTLDYTGGGYARHPYSVAVHRIHEADNPASEAWDWVRHIAGKNWDPPALRCFVLALRKLVGDSRNYDSRANSSVG